MNALLIAAALLAPAAPAQKSVNRPKIAVLDLRDAGGGKDIAATLTDVVTVALNKLGVFDVLSRSDIQRMLQFEQQKQALGCESDTSCLAEIGGALGVALLVTGSVGKVGSSFLVNLSLTDTKTVKVEAREQRQVASADELPAQVEAAARFLVRGLLEGQQGDLIVKASESGADVELDGRIVGVTPLARQTVAGGPHTLKLVKKGFITWARDLDVQKGAPTIVDASLVPSVEFIEEYDARAGTWRTMAWVAAGVGVAGLGFAIGGWMWNGTRIDDYERDIAAQNCQENPPAPPAGDCSGFATRRDEIQGFDVVTQIAGGVGLAALLAGVVLFTQGPTPGIYEQYRPQAAVAPLPGGGWAAAGSVAF
jgi:TolB-like protein